MGFSRQEYWSGLPFHSPGDFPNPGIEPRSSALASEFFSTSTAWKVSVYFRHIVITNSFVIPSNVARQASLSMGFLRQEYWNELSFPSPGYLPDPGIEPTSSSLAGGFFLPLSHQENLFYTCVFSRFSRVQLCYPIDYSLPGSYVHGIL